MTAVDAGVGGKGGKRRKGGMELVGRSLEKTAAAGNEEGVAAEYSSLTNVGHMAAGVAGNGEYPVGLTSADVDGVPVPYRVRDPGYRFRCRSIYWYGEPARQGFNASCMIVVVVGAQDESGRQAALGERRQHRIGISRIDDGDTTGFRSGNEPDIVIAKGLDCYDIVHGRKCGGRG